MSLPVPKSFKEQSSPHEIFTLEMLLILLGLQAATHTVFSEGRFNETQEFANRKAKQSLGVFTVVKVWEFEL